MNENETEQIERAAAELFDRYRNDWNFFAADVFGVNLDPEQRAILDAVQHNARVSVRSGTARGKDFVSAVAALCFLYLTPVWDRNGNLIENTKVALTAPTGRQVDVIMMPEISRLYERARKRGKALPGSLSAQGIKTDNREWFLVGFKADDNNTEAWSGFHASHVMFVCTEATGLSEETFNAIEGNLQGDSRILIVFNPNTTTGYAAKSQSEERWAKFCLNSLHAPNVVARKTTIPGQVDYGWIIDHINSWCEPIDQSQARESENDFLFEGQWFRPNDLFRIKVLGEFPKTGSDVLVPAKWVELAQERYKAHHTDDADGAPLVVGCDVAGMGRDNSVECHRRGNRVERFVKRQSGGKADHMAVAGSLCHTLQGEARASVSIDTIGEGAGVYARCVEVMRDDARVISCKFSAAATNRNHTLTDITGEYQFANLKAWLYWAVRDWLNPDNNTGAELPPGGSLMQEAASVRWEFQSSGKIIMEKKEKTKERLGYSPDELDALANTFHPDAVRAADLINNRGATDDDLEDIFY